MRCLAGDVGGTNTRLALYDEGELLAQHWVKNSEYAELETILTATHRPDLAPNSPQVRQVTQNIIL